MPSLTAPTSPGARARSVSQPLRDGVDPDVFRFGTAGQTSPRSSFHRTLSANTAYGSYGRASGSGLSGQTKGRNRSGSLVTVTEVGGDEPDNINDRLGVGANFNAAWVNAPADSLPGAWVIHPVLIMGAKLLIDSIPGMQADISWTIVNIGYMVLSFIMFHQVTGVPFETSVSTGGAYDDLTLWEQIDAGAQYTPSKKWLTSVPICLFLISTHYTRYNYTLFALNFSALVFVLFPKLPILHRLRFHVGFGSNGDGINTPAPSRPSSPAPRSQAL
ncbi:uncharacterized protein EHS24_001032 [Apiotrichum porosum]|uniref:Sphingolipid homeostasis protein orm1 n=1 Tax=Apiotrichum porosum TaxID=105984 RepID=A0A427YBY8_9TREE|nr:uncharacterized protein EHS24_001032 [Apiotrichum porosum]RSH88487.1 hypothetical protein EHS24_001032 [Apiotrichum porosum]